MENCIFKSCFVKKNCLCRVLCLSLNRFGNNGFCVPPGFHNQNLDHAQDVGVQSVGIDVLDDFVVVVVVVVAVKVVCLRRRYRLG